MGVGNGKYTGLLRLQSETGLPLFGGQDTIEPDCVAGCGHCIRNYACVVSAGVGRNGSKELSQGRRVASKLNIVKVVRPFAKPELVEEKRIVGGWLDPRSHGAVASLSPTRLIDQIYGEAKTQENGLNRSRPSDVVSQLRPGWKAPCSMTIGSALGLCGTS